MLNVFAGDTELPNHPSKVQNIDIIQVCRIDLLDINRAVFTAFLPPVAPGNRLVDGVLPINKDRYETAGYAAIPIKMVTRRPVSSSHKSVGP